jgi:hypothetical protein
LAKERAEAELERAMERAREEMQREMESQRRLKDMGVCCQGLRWVKETGGYRCAGGSHFVSVGQIAGFGS